MAIWTDADAKTISESLCNDLGKAVDHPKEHTQVAHAIRHVQLQYVAAWHNTVFWCHRWGYQSIPRHAVGSMRQYRFFAPLGFKHPNTLLDLDRDHWLNI